MQKIVEEGKGLLGVEMRTEKNKLPEEKERLQDAGE